MLPVRKLCHRLVHARAVRAMAAPTARVRGRTFLTDPEVFHPVAFLSTGILLDYLGALDLRGKRFLDMGTGSGVIGAFAAAKGAAVTSGDVNPRAVALASTNARGNGMAIEVVESNLFAAIPRRTFDVITFNLPFYAKDVRTPFEAVLNAGQNLETIRGFAAGCRDVLAPRERGSRAVSAGASRQ